MTEQFVIENFERYSTHGQMSSYTMDKLMVLANCKQLDQDHYYLHTIEVKRRRGSDRITERSEIVILMPMPRTEPAYPPLGNPTRDWGKVMAHEVNSLMCPANLKLIENAPGLLHAAEEVLDLMAETSDTRSWRAKWNWRLGRRRQDDMTHLQQMDRCEIWNNLMHAVLNARGVQR